MRNLLEMIWQALASFFYASDIRLQKFSSRITFLSFWLVILILLATYSANLTLTSSKLAIDSKYTDYSEIKGAYNIEIATYSDYLGRFII